MDAFPIPVNPQMENTRNSFADNETLFQGFEYYVITNLVVPDYAPFPDDHFNNSGHRKMRAFISGILADSSRMRE